MNDDEPPIRSSPPSGMPETPVGRWVQPFARFFQIESTSGFLLLVCAAIALLLANSPWSGPFAEIWQIRLRVSVGHFDLNKSLLLCINDGLMTIFSLSWAWRSIAKSWLENSATCAVRLCPSWRPLAE